MRILRFERNSSKFRQTIRRIRLCQNVHAIAFISKLKIQNIRPILNLSWNKELEYYYSWHGTRSGWIHRKSKMTWIALAIIQQVAMAIIKNAKFLQQLGQCTSRSREWSAGKLINWGMNNLRVKFCSSQ